MQYFNSNIRSRFNPRSKLKPFLRNIASESIKPNLTNQSSSKNLQSSRLPHQPLKKYSSVLSFQSASNSNLHLTSSNSTLNILTHSTVDSNLPKSVKKSFKPKIITPINIKKLEKFWQRFEKMTGKLKEIKDYVEIPERPKNLKSFNLSNRRASGLPARFKEMPKIGLKEKILAKKSGKRESDIVIIDKSDPECKMNPVRVLGNERFKGILNSDINELGWIWETPEGSSASKSVNFD